jgi:hypothetical protein
MPIGEHCGGALDFHDNTSHKHLPYRDLLRRTSRVHPGLSHSLAASQVSAARGPLRKVTTSAETVVDACAEAMTKAGITLLILRLASSLQGVGKCGVLEIGISYLRSVPTSKQKRLRFAAEETSLGRSPKISMLDFVSTSATQ